MADLNVKSADFDAGARIPAKYTCEGRDIAPDLQWSGAPEGTESFAVIVDDPDAPRGTWVHQVLWNAPSGATSLAQAAVAGTFGKNDFGNNEYGGPCPPPGHGQHRYFFKVYALDTTLDLPASTDKAGLESAMQGHVLAEGQVMGTYERTK